jgi:hypothetical protein
LNWHCLKIQTIRNHLDELIIRSELFYLIEILQSRSAVVQNHNHARNVGTLYPSLTMRREMVASRRAHRLRVTTSVVKSISTKGTQCACIRIK